MVHLFINISIDLDFTQGYTFIYIETSVEPRFQQ